MKNHNLSADELERIIEAIKNGKDPKTDPEMVKIITDILEDLEEIEASETFYENLRQKIKAEIKKQSQPKKQSFWKRYRWGFSSAFGVIVLGGGGYLLTQNFISDNAEIPLYEQNQKSTDRADTLQSGLSKSRSNKKELKKKIVPNNSADKAQYKPKFMAESSEAEAPMMEMDMNMAEEMPRMIMPPMPLEPSTMPPSPEEDREQYAKIEDNPIKKATEIPVSTFSIDVDTGSYSNVRRFLKDGSLPRQDAVRVEEMINYFSYDYPTPEDKSTPFSVYTEIGPAPWNKNTKLLHIGLKGYKKENTERPASNLVFLLDVSGSMNDEDKLPLLKKSLRLLSKNLRDQDKISIVVYAGATGLILDGVEGNNTAKIETALDNLSAGGSTNGGAGIELAYKTAESHFIENGINRIILATDGDFNVGTTNFEALKEMVEQKRKNGVFLTTLGFGTGNYNDQLAEQLADAGNGNYAYIDSLIEAQKVLVQEMGSTLETIAKDVKIQIEFNPKVISEYRLIGYENRILNREDFDNDKVDAGEIGAGHTVTALYEIALVGEGGERLPELRYDENRKDAINRVSTEDEIAFLKIRYKAPDTDETDPESHVSKLLEFPIAKDKIKSDLENTSKNYRFSAAVAAFGQALRGGKYLENFGYGEIKVLANSAKGEDPNGYRSEMVTLVELAKNLSE